MIAALLAAGLLGGITPGPAGAPGETNCHVISSIAWDEDETRQILQCDTRTSAGIIIPNTHEKVRMVYTPSPERLA